ncbi:hypothetical protein C0991_010129 [Blastosporella zonata]|nr:hypothetical protein C0991_010129 [Blastosporella zonata]
MTLNNAHVASSSWHSIRPWSPPLSLSVREITSVSVTFILSSNLHDVNEDLGFTGGDNDSTDETGSSHAVELKKKFIISDALAKGLSVDVNGSPWQRVFIRIEDGADDAVIIIYGLMPGREYDVQLGLMHGDSNGTIRQQVTTEEIELDSSEEPTDPGSPDIDHSTTSSDPPVSTPSTSPNRTLPNTPPSATIPLTVEDRLSQLQHTLSLVNTERESLANVLKSTRRDSQKADAALRSEIETLKRASEKHVAADHRAKQKILSLQEAAKRAQTSTREAEQLVEEMEGLVPELNRQRQEKELQYAKVRGQADQARKERDRQAEKERKKLESMKSELAGLTNKMEKANAKKEKLEGGIISDLEEQLKDVEREVEEAEKEAQAQLTYAMFIDRTDFLEDDLHYTDPETNTEGSPAFPYLSSPRMRPHLPNATGLIGRPIAQQAPIQRPSHNDTAYGQQTPSWNHTPQTHASRSSSLQHQHTPILLTNPHRHPPKSAHTSPSNSISASFKPLNSPTPVNALSSSSTLSSRAQVFEPGRPLKTAIPTSASSAFPATSTPIQRGATRVPGHNTQAKTKLQPQQGPWAGIRNTYDDSDSRD